MTEIRHVLLDADGVVQGFGGDSWRRAMGRHLGDRVEEFMVAIGEMEGPSLTGVEDFTDVFPRVLDAAGAVVADPEAFYTEVWLSIRTFPETVALARSLRETGLGVHLATNQHARRVSYMKQVLGYDDMFDSCFYSCDLGVAKPDPAFFTLVCERLGALARELLFVDDSDVNVAAARNCGLHTFRWHHDDGKDELDRLVAAHGL